MSDETRCRGSGDGKHCPCWYWGLPDGTRPDARPGQICCDCSERNPRWRPRGGAAERITERAVDTVAEIAAALESAPRGGR